jgi:heat shock protein beta
MERLMAAQSSSREQDSMMTNFFKNAKKVLEINPRHPLIEGLLERVEAGEPETDEQLRDTVQTLWDTALVRSGFSLRDTDRYGIPRPRDVRLTFA